MAFAVSAVLVSACFEPADPNAHVVASCRGDCPYGACSDACAASADASCTTPESCLQAYSCSKQAAHPCNLYKAANFQVADAPTPCERPSGAYCVTTVGANGGLTTYAVDCSGQTAVATDCTGVTYCTDAGVPPACKAACGPTYCIH